MKLQNPIKALFGATPIYLANDGKPIDTVTIKYKDVYLFIDIDAETEEPTGNMGWSHDPTMNPQKTVREILIARRSDGKD